MLQPLAWFIGLNSQRSLSTRVTDDNAQSSKVVSTEMVDTVLEIAIYLHRFHNLDLFRQGWYQIKLSMRWEDDEYTAMVSPARVVQYEVPDLGSDDMHGVWRIDDTDNSFSTHPFRIKFAKQDVRLGVMISFDISLRDCLAPPTSAIILKYELMHAPITQRGVELLTDVESSVAIHEFRIPPKAFLGLHCYCPVYFDAFHAVLVDATVHISLLRASYSKMPNDIQTKSNRVKSNSKYDQAESQAASMDNKNLAFVKALITARDSLIEDLLRLGRSIDQNIDLTELTLQIDDMKMFKAALLDTSDPTQASGKTIRKSSDKTLNSLPDELSKDAAAQIFNVLGSQLSYLWSTFLQFHRSNQPSILRFLRDTWAKDRRAEWSIWMVYSKVDMPHQYVSGINNDSSLYVSKMLSSFWKQSDDSTQSASSRAELHRRSISQMKMNNRSIQDMYIFGDPSSIPIIIVERVTNAPRRTLSMNSYFKNVDVIDSPSLSSEPKPGSENRVHYDKGTKLSNVTQQSGRPLKIVVFVHGFQGHHLDLRLVRNQWLLIDPKVEVLMSVANEEKTSEDFREMGRRLAHEVVDFVKEKMDRVSRAESLRDIKLSFVGHSIGNLIIRTALAESIMMPYLRFLTTYVSISGPHLGYLYSSNSLFNSGMWLLKKFKGTQCIHQLTFTDDQDISNTFLYRLCEQKTLENFRNIVLVSSPQDGYVPYHSARMESCPAASADHSKRSRAFLEMLNNCMDQIRAPTVEQRLFMRCDVNFDTSAFGRNFNSFIGRSAHIEFLESDIFAKFIMWSFPDIFR